jgi:prepilin-type N-terminal cleavage/methylation domain-containing protein
VGNRFQNPGGFTLIELVAVISIIGMMLFFAIPRLDNTGEPEGDLKTASRWILLNVQALKSRSVTEHKSFALHAGFDDNAFSIVDLSPPEQTAAAHSPKEYRLPAGVVLTDVEYPKKGTVSIQGTDIYFYKKGYSDKAIIHLKDEEGGIHSIVIEPFLPSARLYDEYVAFN